ncbi:hypothetical protein [Candidatus Thiodictyon syntrophicum]|uniref:hypothetical protein n=1 Tax=Candidatus Thiodictyon syntrophicum TaxID=1166950 RepID=UPI0012FDDAD3|nr:hypothetical protein [Candidatus Thiodictyon syntrophicum]
MATEPTEPIEVEALQRQIAQLQAKLAAAQQANLWMILWAGATRCALWSPAARPPTAAGALPWMPGFGRSWSSRSNSTTI